MTVLRFFLMSVRRKALVSESSFVILNPSKTYLPQWFLRYFENAKGQYCKGRTPNIYEGQGIFRRREKL